MLLNRKRQRENKDGEKQVPFMDKTNTKHKPDKVYPNLDLIFY